MQQDSRLNRKGFRLAISDQLFRRALPKMVNVERSRAGEQPPVSASRPKLPVRHTVPCGRFVSLNRRWISLLKPERFIPHISDGNIRTVLGSTCPYPDRQISASDLVPLLNDREDQTRNLRQVEQNRRHQTMRPVHSPEGSNFKRTSSPAETKNPIHRPVGSNTFVPLLPF